VVTGPDHFREAERLIEAAARSFKAGWPDNAAAQAALAHAHATLALAAATAYPAIRDFRGDENNSTTRAWSAAVAP